MAIYYTAVGLEKNIIENTHKDREHTDREHTDRQTEKAIIEAPLITVSIDTQCGQIVIVIFCF